MSKSSIPRRSCRTLTARRRNFLRPALLSSVALGAALAFASFMPHTASADGILSKAMATAAMPSTKTLFGSFDKRTTEALDHADKVGLAITPTITETSDYMVQTIEDGLIFYGGLATKTVKRDGEVSKVKVHGNMLIGSTWSAERSAQGAPEAPSAGKVFAGILAS